MTTGPDRRRSADAARIGAAWLIAGLVSGTSALSTSTVAESGGIPARIEALEIYPNPSGAIGTFHKDGPVTTADQPFFQPLGSNGRSCATCHRPSSGMSLSLREVRERFSATGGADPLFAPYDGADCPTAGPAEDERAHSLLLSRGVIRVPLPWPPRNSSGKPLPVEFALSITPENDPTRCNTDPNQGLAAGLVSVYRRPPTVAQMNFKTLRADGQGPPLQGSITWDGRQPTLEAQAIEATRRHLQATQDLTQDQLTQLVAYQVGVFTAQLFDPAAGRLDESGGQGGPLQLRQQIPLPAGGTTFTEYSRWAGSPGKRGSIARGEALFNGREFAARNVDGFNEVPGVGNPARGTTCSTCHNIGSSGADFFADPQRNIGIGGTGMSAGGPLPAEDLPRFTLTCRKGVRPGFLGLGPIVTNDPGRALVTGKCADIGRFTVPQLRALAAREPYFHDGTAQSLAAVVNFYNRRFSIGLTPAEQEDLVSFLSAL